jgi:NADH-quinone oxidoreductase subunit M
LESWILTIVILSPLAGASLLLIGSGRDHARLRMTALVSSLATLILTLLAAWLFFDAAHTAADPGGFHLEASAAWLGADNDAIDVKFHVGVDAISLWLLILTAVLTPIAICASFTAIADRVREYYILLLLLEVGMLGVFCSLDLLLFYVCFEFTLVPLYFLIGVWGGPERRKAANKFFIYTLAGSVLTFAGVLYLAYHAYNVGPQGVFTLDIQRLTAVGQSGAITLDVQRWLFIAFAAGFAIKVPFFPVHTWLPLAHTEAPTAGSVLLAAVLLKLGTYGFFRLSLPMLPDAAYDLAPIFATLAVIGIIYGALCAWVQTDVKKLVAYSSVSHLGFCMLGMFSLKMAGATGAVLYMINHGLSTGALFLVIGMMYERYHTRDIHAIGGLAKPMPWLAFFLIFFTLSSIGLPGLNGFISEFLVLLGTATSATVTDGLPAGPLGYAYVIPAALGIILGAVYMLWMCQRVLFGPLTEPPNTPDSSRGLTPDLNAREKWLLTPIAFACVALGVYPKLATNSIEHAIAQNVFCQTAPPKDTLATALDRPLFDPNSTQTLELAPKGPAR